MGYFLDGFDFNMANLLLVPIAADFGIPVILSATLISAAYCTRWFGGMMFGAIGDRWGRKVSMVTSILLYAVGTFVCALAPAFWVLFAARLFIGLGMAGEYSSSTTYIQETWPKQYRNKAVAFVVAGFSFGGAVTAQVYKLVEYLVQGTALEPHAWRIFFAIGILPVILALWMRRSISEADDYVSMRAAQEEIAKKDPNYKAPVDMLTVLYRKSPRRAIINLVCTLVSIVMLISVFLGQSSLNGWVIGFFWVFVFATIISFTVQFMKRRWPLGMAIIFLVLCCNLIGGPMQALWSTYLTTDLKVDTGMMANLTSVFWIGQVIGCIVVGFLGDRWGSRKSALVGLTCSIVVFAPVFIVNHDRMAQGGVWMLIFIVFLLLYELFIATNAVMPKYLGYYFPTSDRNAGVGFMLNVGSLGGAVAPVLVLALEASVFQPMGLGLGWTIFTIVTLFTVIVVISLAVNLPARVLSWTRPEEVREQDWADHDITNVAEEVKAQAARAAAENA
ncbi:MFS transporter [Neoactinobaculum massilliense]|uniref:MFS transporter n=1 Tax=Neoactinobaculum massilliense TaxID=2364794 RepID=UPI002406B9E1|nr:MFS transporter [Neoactinobaculum massilliense]